MFIDGNEIADQLASKAPDIHLRYLSFALAYRQGLPGKWSGSGWAGCWRSIGSPFMDKETIRTLLKDPLLKELGITEHELEQAKNNDEAGDSVLSFKKTSI